MPTPDLAAVRALLPWWVDLGAWIATPLLACTIGWLSIWLCARCNRVPLTGRHWTEVARLHFAANRLFQAQVFTQSMLAGVLTAGLATGVLTPDPSHLRPELAGLLVWLGSRVIAHHRARRVMPWLSVGDYVHGQLFLLVIFLPIPVVALLMLLGGPSTFPGNEWRFMLVYGGGLALMAWLLRGGGLVLARGIGMATPADRRLQAIVDEAGRRSAHTVRRAWIVRTPMANAAALPRSNEVLVTTRALAVMTDAELVAILLHEFGHLKETRRDGWKRAIAVGFFAMLGLARPLVDVLGPVGSAGLLLAVFLSALLAARAARRLEAQADEHALEHETEHEGGLYARSLERLYELNLVPAVMPGKRRAHPHLYDRMLAAGVTPDYERPLPPQRRVGQALLFGTLALGLYVGQVLLIRAADGRSYESPAAASVAAMLSGGSLTSIGAFGYHWSTTQPEQAIVVLAFAAAHSQSPEYPARLAGLLAATDAAAARTNLQRAEELCADWKYVAEWLRALIDDARERLGMPKRVW